MKKKVPVAEKKYTEVDACDRCSEQSLQDDSLRLVKIGPFKFLLHNMCIHTVRNNIATSFGVYLNSIEVDTMDARK